MEPNEPNQSLQRAESSDVQVRVERARMALQDSLGQAADAVRRNTGLRLGPVWMLPLLAAAAGATLALAVKRRNRRRSDVR